MAGSSKTAVFVRLASRPIPRVTRMMRVATERGYDCVYVGARRDVAMADKEKWDGFPVVRVGRHFPLVNGSRLLTYVGGVLLFNVALLRELARRRPAVLHASDFEAALGCLAYRLIRRVPIIYNIHDNLADRYDLHLVLRRVLNLLEGVVVLLADECVVPEGFRRDALPRWCRARVQVIRNAPVDLGWQEPDLSGDRVRLLYAGWLDEGRGLQGLLDLARAHPWLEVRLAGEGEAALRNRVVASGATYLGFLDHAEVMRETAACHFVVALYDPSRPINRAAAPNKLAEALSAARPVLINEEVMVAHAPAVAECVVRVPYAEIPSLADLVRALYFTDGGRRYRVMCQLARGAYESEYDWHGIRQQMDDLFARLER